MKTCFFCSGDPTFRNPTGAVPAGTAVHFKICLPREMKCSAASLMLCADDAVAPQVYGMFWCGMEGDSQEWWECDASFPTAGLYWYTFSLQAAGAMLTLTKGDGGFAILSGVNRFQLTVYEPGWTTPDWLKGGIIYQIFPDRFASDGTVPPSIEDRVLHTDWSEQPNWQANEKGKYTNQDYFGGNLAGITEKLPYLASLGVTCLYLNPIFEAHSNHRYNTADYEKIDPYLGDESDLRKLCDAAKSFGIRVILDGVFNHTGSDSRYFNRFGRYDSVGAAQSKESPYYTWYDFTSWPERYSAWWGFESLPSIRHDSTDFVRYIAGPNGILQKWMSCGVSGWRLDVVDELSDVLLDAVFSRVKQCRSDAVVIGEVWEDASNKESYGHRRRYLLGRQLDSVMNYPFREGILRFVRDGNAAFLAETVRSVLENYTPQVIHLLMNMIGTHDTERALTALAGEPCNGRSREWQAQHSLSESQKALGFKRLRLAMVLQYFLPGVPSVYYGDEAGMEGYSDPFNRACYPWGHENRGLLDWTQFLGQIRKSTEALKEGRFLQSAAEPDVFAFSRIGERDELLCAVNRSTEPSEIEVDPVWQHSQVLYGALPQNGRLFICSESCVILRRNVPSR